MYRFQPFFAIAAALALPAVAIDTLHGLADRPWFRIDLADPVAWMEATALVDALIALSRPAALVAAYWCAGATALYLLAVLTGSERARTMVAPLVLPSVRRLTDRLVAGSLAVGVLTVPLLPAIADQPAPVVAPGYVPASRSVLLPEHQPEPPSATASITAIHPGSVASTDPFRNDPAPPIPVPATDRFSRGTVVVEAGDHLWGLAEQRLAFVLGRAVSDHEIAPYWRAVVEENLPGLRSGNPDLVQPGEVVRLPHPVIPEGS